MPDLIISYDQFLAKNQKNSRCNQFELFMRFLLFSNFWPEKSQNKNGREYEKDSNQGFY